jgi:uncharacterized delta-60 repeat protein
LVSLGLHPSPAWAQAGAIDPSYKPSVMIVQTPEVVPEVKSVLVRDDGKILFAGDFNMVNGTRRPGLALLNPDGSVDPAFVPTVSGQPFLEPDGRVLINQGSLMLRLNVDGSVDGSFLVEAPTNSTISTLAVQPDGKIVLDEATNRGTNAMITRVDPDGRPDSILAIVMHDPLDRTNAVMSLAVQPDGKIVVGGEFPLAQIGNNFIGGFIRLNPDGNPDSHFQGLLPSPISQIVLQPDGRILTVQYGRVFRTNADGTTDTQFQSRTALQGFQSISSLVLQSDGKILIAGSAPGTTNLSGAGLVRLNSDGSLDKSFNPAPMLNLSTNANGAVGSGTVSVNALAIQGDGRIVVGGRFTSVGGVGQLALARLNSDGSLDTTLSRLETKVTVESPGQVNAIAVQPDGKAIIGGAFDSVDDAAKTNLARLNPDGSLDTTFSAPLAASSAISRLTLQPDGRLLIGGTFTNLDGAPRNQLARLNTDGTLDGSFDPGSGPVPARSIKTVVLQPDGKVLVGGSFTSFSGRAQLGLVRLNSDGTLDTNFLKGDVSQLRGTINAIDIDSQARIVVGGSFQIITNGLFRSALARFDQAGHLDPVFAPYLLREVQGGYPPRFDPSLASVITLIAQTDGKFVVSGIFDIVDGHIVPIARVRLNEDGTFDSSLDWMSIVNRAFPVVTFQPDGKIIIAGSGVTRLNPDGSLDPTFGPASSGPAAFVSSIALEPGSMTLLVGGSYSSFYGFPRTSLVRIYTVPQPQLSPPSRNSNGDVQLTLNGEGGYHYRIEVSSNLVEWTTAATVTLTNSTQAWVATDPLKPSRQFYRVLRLP